MLENEMAGAQHRQPNDLSPPVALLLRWAVKPESGVQFYVRYLAALRKDAVELGLPNNQVYSLLGLFTAAGTELVDHRVLVADAFAEPGVQDLFSSKEQVRHFLASYTSDQDSLSEVLSFLDGNEPWDDFAPIFFASDQFRDIGQRSIVKGLACTRCSKTADQLPPTEPNQPPREVKRCANCRVALYCSPEC